MSWLIDKIRLRIRRPKQPDLHDNPEADSQRLSLLTTEEYKVFMLLREGFTEKECAQRLGLRRGEVKKRTKSIYRKLHVRSLAELIVKYHENR